ncbi:MAG: phage tail tape measure protein [Bacteroidales bacterium]|nr:phage tail tape measure protein [Bacteroidales bacterium]
MADKKYTYILDFKGKTDQMQKQVGGLKGMLKGAAVAAGALFAADKIMDAARAVGEYAKKMSTASGEVEKLMGLQGAALNAVTGQATALADVYDVDMKDSISGMNQLMVTFGENSKSAFNIMNAGLASAANANGDFLEQLQEYSIHFKEAGLQASEMVAILAEGNKMGVFNDKAADTIKEGSIRLREMTKATKEAIDGIGLSSTAIEQGIKTGTITMFEAMQQVSARLQNLPPESAAVGTALADIFGGPGEDALQFVFALDDVNTDLRQVILNAGGAAAANMKYAESMAKFNEMGAQVFGGWNTLITNIKTAFMDFAVNAIQYSVDIINKFIKLYNESEDVKKAVGRIGVMFDAVKIAVETFFKIVFDNFKDLGKIVINLINGNFNDIPGIFQDMFNRTIDGVSQGVVDIYNEFEQNWNKEVEKTYLPPIKLDMGAVAEAGETAGRIYAKSMQDGMAARKGNVPLPTMTSIAPTSVDQGAFASNIVTEYSTVKNENELLAGSFEELSQSAAGSFNTIAGAIGGAAGGWMGFVGTLFDQIPQLITQIAALTGAQQASSMAVVGAKQSEAMAGAAAGASKLPFPANLIAMLGAVAAVVSIFASIPKFATGGIVPGGSFSGDKMLIRANSGEEVLTRNDPRHSFNQQATMSSGSVNVQLEQSGLEISGETLRILLKKVERKMALRN